MPISFKWYDNSQTILIWKMCGTWSWEDFDHMRDESNALVRATGHSVAVIVDITELHVVPPQFMFRAQNALDLAPDNINVRLVVGANRFVRALIHSHQRLTENASNRYHLVLLPSMQDALNWLTEQSKIV